MNERLPERRREADSSSSVIQQQHENRLQVYLKDQHYEFKLHLKLAPTSRKRSAGLRREEDFLNPELKHCRGDVLPGE
ncbi:hypothetical protein AMECASPLE_002548 [Ameca splendens]|uniref:Uncharacterized protein n=1 Tax=Ameca splendens TaxID=208324 RepID=A0ABV0YKC4_9TELE